MLTVNRSHDIFFCSVTDCGACSADYRGSAVEKKQIQTARRKTLRAMHRVWKRRKSLQRRAGEVIPSEKHAWADIGTDAYQTATGEN